MALSYGFVGFGEVAAVLSEEMVRHGVRVMATDVLLDQEGGEAILRDRRRSEEIELVSLSVLLEESDVVISAVTTMVALRVAGEVAPSLRADQIYLDLNSTSPGVKREMATVIGSGGGEFVEAAVLGAVGATGARTRILLCGERAEGIAEQLTVLGLNATFYSKKVGEASTFKMLRSIFSKGLECLIIELLIAARRAGIEEALWSDITTFMGSKPFDVIADNWTRTHGAAYERRYHEMLQVVETMKELEIRPIMTEATAAFFERSVSMELASRLGSSRDVRNAVIDALEQADRPAR